MMMKENSFKGNPRPRRRDKGCRSSNMHGSKWFMMLAVCILSSSGDVTAFIPRKPKNSTTQRWDAGRRRKTPALLARKHKTNHEQDPSRQVFLLSAIVLSIHTTISFPSPATAMESFPRPTNPSYDVLWNTPPVVASSSRPSSQFFLQKQEQQARAQLDQIQELQDNRLEQCDRTSGTKAFDQCFFYGTGKAMVNSNAQGQFLQSRPATAFPHGPPTW